MVDLLRGEQNASTLLLSSSRDPADLKGKRENPQPALEGAHDMLEIGPFSVHFVHKRDRRDLVFLRRAPHRF